MSVQVGGQALGPVIAGFMFDYFDSYRIPFTFFAVAVFMAGIMALAAKPPEAPTPALRRNRRCFGLIRPATSNSGRLTIPRATALLSPWRPRRLGPAFFVQTTGHETGGEVCASLGRDSSQLGMRMREDDSSNRMKTTPARLAAMEMVQARS